MPDPADAEDPDKPTKCDELAAHPDDPTRLRDTGVSFEVLEQHVESAITSCRQAVAAEPDNARFTFQLARALDAAEEYREALKLYVVAAERGHAGALNNIGVTYARGAGVARDDEEAVRWFRKGAEKGYAPAMSNLGVAYEQGQGVARDYEEAVRWFRKCAEKGYALAMFRLAKLYNAGKGVARDDAEAARLIAEALRLGSDYVVDQMTNNSQVWGRQFRLELQRVLKAEGVFQGPIDGSFGPATKNAIKKLANKS